MSEVFAYGIVPGTEGVELPLMGKLTNFDSVSQHIRQNKNVPLRGRIGGEGVIRTLEPFRVTHIPGVRARPDYATSPV